MPTKIITDNQLQRNVYNKISPKILSPDADSNFFVNEADESGRILLKLRLLNKLSIEDICKKLNIEKSEYKKMEKGEDIPSKEISIKLMCIFNLNINK
tara:strand:+ start:1403 stop:1696 length:294 start_codon:yes stop_codon:yes gene_type:complete